MTERTAPKPPPPSASGQGKQPPRKWAPPAMRSIEDTGLNLLTIGDLVLKVLYFSGFMTGVQIADYVKLPFTGVLDQTMEFLKREKYVEVKGSGGVGEIAYQYLVTDRGSAKAREAMERTNYAGPCPVTLRQYVAAMHAQNQGKRFVTAEMLQNSLGHLVVNERMLSKVGPAVNSGKSVFLYGPPGNGKTTISEAVGRIVLGADIWIPYAVDIDGQVVRVLDSVHHEILEASSSEASTGRTGVKRDPRWVRVRRPMIMVGGELTLAGLDLVYDDVNKYYEAPYQVKSNGGMFLIDDFGRQQVRPRDLLNRWIVPLEKGVDFLTLATGRKIEVPFYVLIVFSTNLEPRDLVDEAFLRRIRHKIEVGDPSYEEFREIFRRVCESKRIPYDDKGLAYLLQEWYI
ncbi:MAG: ATP-binding protein, partial [Anaerolineae bacterium]|nr:ATP-binding protein [Anaerolineae bacterium]